MYVMIGNMNLVYDYLFLHSLPMCIASVAFSGVISSVYISYLFMGHLDKVLTDQ